MFIFLVVGRRNGAKKNRERVGRSQDIQVYIIYILYYYYIFFISL